MPTGTSNRPFLSSFLAAFRAHSSPTASLPSRSTNGPGARADYNTRDYSTFTTSTTTSTSNSSNPAATSQSPSAPRGIATKAGSAYAPRQPLSRSPGPAPASSTSPTSTSPPPTSTSFGSAAAAVNSPTSPANRSNSRGRRGSDSSSEGFRDALGGEKWYIGGRNAGGEERFYRLGVVRRQRSFDSSSWDRLSL